MLLVGWQESVPSLSTAAVAEFFKPWSVPICLLFAWFQPFRNPYITSIINYIHVFPFLVMNWWTHCSHNFFPLVCILKVTWHRHIWLFLHSSPIQTYCCTKLQLQFTVIWLCPCLTFQSASKCLERWGQRFCILLVCVQATFMIDYYYYYYWYSAV